MSVTKPRVVDIMSRDVVTIYASDSLHDALKLLVENHVSALPVVNGAGHCLGILSTTDVVNMTSEQEFELDQLDQDSGSMRQWLSERLANSLGHHSVSEIMTDQVLSVTPDSSVKEAAEAMVEHGVHHLPVVNAEKKLQGIVSTLDVLSVLNLCST
ncbi:MAG: CBS domain-containing membrane protein [Pirellulaceae bacterium]|jgi:CBS domain-containing membrane protein